MTGNLDMAYHDIDNLKTVVENDSGSGNFDEIKHKAINFEFAKKMRDYLKRLLATIESLLLSVDGSDPMTGSLNMSNNSIINLKESEAHQSTYAVNVKFVANSIVDNNTVLETSIDTKIEESEERSIKAVQQENGFEKVMKDDLFKEDDDDLHKVGAVNRDFHKVNQQTYQFKIDYDSQIGYYSTRLSID